MVNQERRAEIASQLTKSSVDLQKWSHKEISIVYPMLPSFVTTLSVLGYETSRDPNGFILAGTTILLFAGVGEFSHILGRITEGRETLPISDFLLPKVASPIMKGIANLIGPADKQIK